MPALGGLLGSEGQSGSFPWPLVPLLLPPSSSTSAFPSLPVLLSLSPSALLCVLLLFAAASALRFASPRLLHRVVCWVLDVLSWQLRVLWSCVCVWRWVCESVHPHPVYLLSVSVFRAPPAWRVSSERFRAIAGGNFRLPPATVDFCSRVLAHSGLGEHTAFPPGICDDPPHTGLSDARAEAEVVLFACLDELFSSCPAVRPSDVDVLIVNCSLFTPTPSLASLIINHYRMRRDVQSYNLGGMGCSAGVIGVHLARDLLQVHRSVRCLVVSTEVITQSIHLGNEPAFLVSNALFRCGGSAQLYSNRWSDRYLPPQGVQCRWALQWTYRTHLGSDDRAYRVVHQEEDSEGHRGVRLGKELLAVAAMAIRIHLSHIAHRLLPWTELSKVALSTALHSLVRIVWHRGRGREREEGEEEQRRDSGGQRGEGREEGGRSSSAAQSDAAASASAPVSASASWWSLPYSPSFSRSSLHPCIHAGGRAVLNGLQRALKLSDADLHVARHILHAHGNTSSSSVFYQLHALDELRSAHHTGEEARTGEGGGGEGKKIVRRGDEVWLLAFGSGFKANSALLKAL